MRAFSEIESFQSFYIKDSIPVYSRGCGQRHWHVAQKGRVLTYVIAEPCVDVMDRSCVEECPVDCIYEGGRALYIHPDECVDCGACEPACPVEAIFYEDDVPEQWSQYVTDNADFFETVLPGAEKELGSPGGAHKLGPTGRDTELVASFPVGTREGSS